MLGCVTPLAPLPTSHSPYLQDIADQVVIFNKGVIEQRGTPEVRTPARPPAHCRCMRCQRVAARRQRNLPPWRVGP